jgi:hypothetical protein
VGTHSPIGNTVKFTAGEAFAVDVPWTEGGHVIWTAVGRKNSANILPTLTKE